MSTEHAHTESRIEAEQNAHARDLTQFQLNILAILAEEGRYGLAVKRELEDYYGEEINHGRLYPNLDQLVDKGLVEKSERDKRTNDYAITEAGEELVHDRAQYWINKLDLSVATEDDEPEQIAGERASESGFEWGVE